MYWLKQGVRRHRGILATLVLSGLVAGGTATTWYFQVVDLPHPSHASSEQLLRWVVQRDLESETPDVRLALVDRLVAELNNSGLRVDRNIDGLSERQKQTLHKNLELIKSVWFESRADRYAEIAPDEQMLFLDKQLRTIDLVRRLPVFRRDDTEQNERFLEAFFDDLGRWVARAEAARKQRMQQLIQDAVVSWLATNDAASLSDDARRSLALRIADSLDRRSVASESRGLEMSLKQHDQLRENAELLFEFWFREQARRYRDLSDSERRDFVATQVRRVGQWGVLDYLLGLDQRAGNAARLFGLASMTKRWVDRAPPDVAEDVRRLLGDVQRHLLVGPE